MIALRYEKTAVHSVHGQAPVISFAGEFVTLVQQFKGGNCIEILCLGDLYGKQKDQQDKTIFYQRGLNKVQSGCN